MDNFRKQAEQLFAIHLTPLQLTQFQLYEQILLERNQKINLTAIRLSEDVKRKHFIDSMSCSLAWKKNTIPSSCIDIGTGAGFPGIVLKIVYPTMNITLVESTQKKANFCNDVIHALQLKDITVIPTRAEELIKQKQYVSHFDVAVARAVAQLPVLIPNLVPFIKPTGIAIAMKGNNAGEEIQLSKEIFGQFKISIKLLVPYTLPQEERSRTIIVLGKVNQNMYP